MMLLQTVQQALIVNYVNLCAFTLLVYDSFLNIEDEIKYIWCKEWTFVKCVYLSSKYLAFVDAALTANLLLKHGLSSHECMSLYKTVVSLVWIGVVLAEVILQCHAWAISGLSRYVLGYLVVTDIIFFGLTLMSLVRSFEGFQFMAQSPISIIRPCFPKKTLPGNFIYIDYICIMVAETNVLIIMLWRGVVQWRGSGIALVHILYRDGMVYIFFMLSLSAANLLFYTAQDASMYWMVLPEAQRIGHAILVSRLVLNVRSCAEPKEQVNLQTISQCVHWTQQIDLEVVHEVSAIDFAARGEDAKVVEEAAVRSVSLQV